MGRLVRIETLCPRLRGFDCSGQVDMEERRQGANKGTLSGTRSATIMLFILGANFDVLRSFRLAIGFPLPVKPRVSVVLASGRCDWCNLDWRRVLPSAESTSNERTANPWVHDVCKVEFDRSVSPALEILASVDQALDASGIEVGPVYWWSVSIFDSGCNTFDLHGCEVQYESAEKWLVQVVGSRIFPDSSSWSWVVPRTINETRESDILSTASVFLGIINDGGSDVRRVRVSDRLLQSEDINARGRGFHDCTRVAKTYTKHSINRHTADKCAYHFRLRTARRCHERYRRSRNEP